MSKQKIEYGIDLGTTNSAIARIDNGVLKIIKSEKHQKDTTPSCVYYNEKKVVFTGDDAIRAFRKESVRAFRKRSHEAMNSFIEFKRTMGTDKKYLCKNLDERLSSEQLSAEILKTLKTYIRDDDFRAVVITVPARFEQHQYDATQRAAKLAGFEQIELLQEPIAASLAYGIDAKNIDGHWLVFDFGGGTFDVALMKVEEGIMRVVDTQGDNQLGGKNIDYAIIDHILIPYLQEHYSIEKCLLNDEDKLLLRDSLKPLAEDIKMTMSTQNECKVYRAEIDEEIGTDDVDNEMGIDLLISLEAYEKAAMPSFQRAIDLTLKLLSENGMTGKDLETIVLVGGPTFSQTLRKLLKEQVTEKLNIKIDPMTAVARGAALFATTTDLKPELKSFDSSNIQLTLKYPETTVETEETLGIKVDRNKTHGTVPETIFVEVFKTDKSWSSGQIPLEGDAEILTIPLIKGVTNTFDMKTFDSQGNYFACEPSSFSIIQGLKVANATLSQTMCIEAFHTDTQKQHLIPIKGLVKNQNLPATGNQILKTQKDIRPGIKDDRIKIPIYNGDPFTRASLNNWAGTIVIDGEDLPQFLPKNSEVEIKLNIDTSRNIVGQFFFPYLDETIEKKLEEFIQPEFNTNEIHDEISEAKQSIAVLVDDQNVIDNGAILKLYEELKELDELIHDAGADHNTKTAVMGRLREVLKELDTTQEKVELPSAKAELQQAIDELITTSQRYGNENTEQIVTKFKDNANYAIAKGRVGMIKELTQEINSFDFALVSQDIGLWISLLKGMDQEFDTHEWKSKKRAQQLIEEGNKIIVSKPNKEKLQGIVRELFALLPKGDQPITGKRDDEILRK